MGSIGNSLELGYMKEHDLQSNIMMELSKHGKIFRVNVGAFYTKDGRFIPSSLPKGFSDLLFVQSGLASFIEVKVKPNKPTPEQNNFLVQMQNEGCRAGVAYSVEEALKICRIR